jgi:hypothetical protein
VSSTPTPEGFWFAATRRGTVASESRLASSTTPPNLGIIARSTGNSLFVSFDEEGPNALGFTSLWGAQRRSCSWPVVVEQTTEQIASTNLARLILADNRQPSTSVRCLKPERPDAGCRARH